MNPRENHSRGCCVLFQSVLVLFPSMPSTLLGWQPRDTQRNVFGWNLHSSSLPDVLMVSSLKSRWESCRHQPTRRLFHCRLITVLDKGRDQNRRHKWRVKWREKSAFFSPFPLNFFEWEHHSFGSTSLSVSFILVFKSFSWSTLVFKKPRLEDE